MTKEGQQVSGHRLIDGHHRAARCLELGIPYRAYILNEQESIEILKKALAIRPEMLSSSTPMSRMPLGAR